MFEQVLVSARVPTALVDEFRARAIHDDRTLSSALRQAMRRYVDDGPESIRVPRCPETPIGRPT